ncbi:MAG: pyridoxal kinase PdxY [Rhodospirillales bacterium]|nr:pyridoxal kinase PdxY [Rhodospirillales bacterium]MDP6773745.1 pyridoxal kinase PdxY [Rhodospirillales bacterium]
MAILSIQSSVAYGHVGNAAAVFALQCLGFEVWPVNTVAYSNHPGYGDWRGRVADASEVAALIEGIAARGALADCRAVLGGYLGAAETGPVVLDAVAAVKAANGDALYCCDPVIGDAAEGVYVADGVAEFIKSEAVGRADILLPNAFELEYLTGRAADTTEHALAAARVLLERGPRLVVVTSLASSLVSGAGNAETVETLAVSPSGAWLVAVPRLSSPAKGTGDLFTALFLGHYLQSRRPGQALGAAASAVFAVLAETAKAGRRELALVAARDELVRPLRRFEALRLR